MTAIRRHTVHARRIAMLAGLFGLACSGCSRVDESLPEPKNAGLQVECYPVNYLKQPPPIHVAFERCPLAHPERAATYVIVITVGTMVLF